MHLSHPYPLPLLSPCTFLPFPCRCWRCTPSNGRNMDRPTALVRQPEQKDTSVRDKSLSQSQRRLHILLQICMHIHAPIDARFQWVTCNGTKTNFRTIESANKLKKQNIPPSVQFSSIQPCAKQPKDQVCDVIRLSHLLTIT